MSAGVEGHPVAVAVALGIAAARAGVHRGRWVAGADVAARITWTTELAGRSDTSLATDRVVALIGTSLATQESVPAAFAMLLLHPDDPWAACCAAASLGGDTDTIAAMTGAMAGAVHGVGAFPAEAVATVPRGQRPAARGAGRRAAGAAMTGRVISTGNALVDVVAAVPHLPDRGGDVLAAGGRLEVGGGGFRALVAARAAGADALFAGRIGTGPFGDRVRAALAAIGVSAPLPPVPSTDSGFVLTAIEPDGERTFMTVPGAESAEPALEGFAVEPEDVVHVHGYGLVAASRGPALAGFVLGLPEATTVLLDPGPFGADADPEVLARLLPRIDWWSGNEAEARAATGLGDAAAAGRLLAGTARAGAIVRLGAEGCLVAIRGEAVVHVPAPRVVALDSNGAGDTHVGTFLAALLRGGTPLEAAAAANEAAARFVSERR